MSTATLIEERDFLERQVVANPDVHPLRIRLDFADSYTRAEALLSLYARPDVMPRAEWFETLGMEWSDCDNIGAYVRSFRHIFQHADRAELDAAMTPNELRSFADLPDMLTVYRGCYYFNERGLSWSLSREVAQNFVTLHHRYKRTDLRGRILTGRVPKRRCILKLDREEHEVIAPIVRAINRELVAPEVAA